MIKTPRDDRIRFRLFVCTNFKDEYGVPCQAVIVAKSRQVAVLSLIAELKSKNWLEVGYVPDLKELKYDEPGIYVVRYIDHAKIMEDQNGSENSEKSSDKS